MNDSVPLTNKGRRKKDFFISYNSNDEPWAEWIASILEDEGYSTVIMAWDFGPGANFVDKMDQVGNETDHTIFVVSPDFLSSPHCKTEFQVAYRAERKGNKRLLPVRVRDCELDGILGGYAYIDLVGKDEDVARKQLVKGINTAVAIVKDGRAIPENKPKFPGRAFPGAKQFDVTDVEHTETTAPKQLNLDYIISSIRQDLPTSLAPIIIALEEKDNQLTEDELLLTERHMTVSLKEGHIAELEVIDKNLAEEATIQDVIDFGLDVWNTLEDAQPWLKHLMENVSDAGKRQPIAWAGRVDLLQRLCKIIPLACMHFSDNINDLISVGYGSHYFHPVCTPDLSRNMQKRRRRNGAAKVQVKQLKISNQNEAEEENLQAMVKALSGEILLISAQELGQAMIKLAELLEGEINSPSRLLIGFGSFDLQGISIQKMLSRLPCISIGDGRLAHKEVIRAIRRTLPDYLSKQAVACALASIRGALIKHAYVNNDHELFKAALTWTTWSWIGRPLFARYFGEIQRAAYPHLMDLRSIASRAWYFERVDVPKPYRVEKLVARAADPQSNFHFYLSGAGGTGKSCFLKNVYDTYSINRPDVLPIWYKVDAPSSEWENIENRVKQEIDKAIRKRLLTEADSILPNAKQDLGVYLTNLVANLNKNKSDINEIVLFIDQLERTFESGDNPEEYRLIRISNKFVDLLETVKVGEGVRVFIASRKQYLPDFLRSSQSAYENHLHFNVLQKINEPNSQIQFVQTILKWCKDVKLVHNKLEIDDQASKELANTVDGHPLKLMLVLIQIFSQGETGLINKQRLVDDDLSWRQLFHLDEQLAAKDEIDWYFLLAMAHARTEIVRFEEVWWRLRMVKSSITHRANELGRQGVLERLWLLGHLGRTIFARPSGDDPAKFLEFFHANLRDHLISEVMNYGGEEMRIKGATGGTPPVWKSMDRLVAAARDWKQSQQLLQSDDVKFLMEHKDVFVEPIKKEGGEGDIEAFYLMFLRDTEENRDELFQAAKECFVFSAIVHDILGRWAFKQLIPDIDQQVRLCKNWLKRCDKDSRLKILQYLIELKSEKAENALAEMIFDQTQSDLDEVWEHIADILSEPLFASRYRSKLAAFLLEYLQEKRIDFPDDNEYSKRFGAFCVATCAADRDEFFALMKKVTDNVTAVDDTHLQGVMKALLSDKDRMEQWLNQAGQRGVDVSIASREIHNVIPPRIELRAGDMLRDKIDDTLVAKCHDDICDQLGLPLPDFDFNIGETTSHEGGEGEKEEDYIPGYELELRLDGQRVALGDFYPDMQQTLRRHWDFQQLNIPAENKKTLNDALQEAVVWVQDSDLNQLNWDKPQWGFEQAIFNWTLFNLRKHIDRAFKIDSLGKFIQDVFSLVDPRLNIHEFQRIISGNFHALLRVFVNLSWGCVPIASRRVDLLLELQRLVGENNDITITIPFLTQKLRELVSADICRRFLDKTNQLPVLILDAELEEKLINKIHISKIGFNLNLSTDDALTLVATIRGQFESILRKQDESVVLVCEDELRAPLFRLIQHFDTRIFVLSFSEIAPTEIQLVSKGVISGISIADGE